MPVEILYTHIPAIYTFSLPQKLTRVFFFSSLSPKRSLLYRTKHITFVGCFVSFTVVTVNVKGKALNLRMEYVGR
ncbi:hypothetical protein RJT34_15070 [Clitoria ternatea]|uniref:Uncharacterized protein n=1 Tax=Clitoria ternatea TaxID=43366 RepID=A0AAN9JRF0_CLITE